MKKLLSLFVCLMLVSCIDVDDFSLMWGQAGIDPKLEGVWLTGDGGKTPDLKNDKWELIRKEDYYLLKLMRKSEGEQPPQLLRSLAWKDDTYLLIKDLEKEGGSLIRYTIEGNTVTVYGVSAPDAQAWLEKTQPGVKNIRVVNTDYFHGLKVMLLDPSVMDTLSKMPREYWKIAGKFIKL